MIDAVIIISSLLVAIGIAEGVIYFRKWLDLHSIVGNNRAFILGTPFLSSYIVSSIFLLSSMRFYCPWAIGLFGILCLILVFPAFIELSRLLLITKDNVERHLNYTPKGKKVFIV